jgi:Skp family chaperone for outer membrane proteins
VLLGLETVSAAEEPPYKRLLQGDDATRAAALEKQIDKLREAGSFKEAQAVARTLVELRSRVQGENHWQAGDARRLASTLEKIVALPADAQAQLAQTVKMDRTAEQLEGQAHYREATALRQQQLEVCQRLLSRTAK